MSNVPTPKTIPPTPQQVDRTLQVVVGHAQNIITNDPTQFAALRASFLAFYTHPTFQLILGIPSQVPPTNSPPLPNSLLKAELSELKSTIQALSKTVSDLQPKVTRAQPPPPAQTPPHTGNPSAQGKGPSPPPPPTYASRAATPARASLVLTTGVPNLSKHLQDNLIYALANWLGNAGHLEVRLSAAKFTKKGHFVITAHPSTTQSRLDTVSDGLAKEAERYLSAAGSPTSPSLTARANVKWSKILINSVPVGIRKDEKLNRGPWTPDECHRSLIMHNPSCSSLTIAQKPSWVHPPSTLTINSQSSLVMAFEDPDGSIRRSLLANKFLYIHGTRAKVTRWKEPSHAQSKSPTPSTAHPHSFATAERQSAAPLEKNVRSAVATPPESLPSPRNAPLPANPPPATRSKSRGGGPQ